MNSFLIKSFHLDSVAIRKSKEELKNLMLCRVSSLLEISNNLYKTNPKLSRIYAKYAFDLVKRYKIKLRELKWKFCRKCFTPWIKGKTVDLIKEKGKLVYICKECGYKRKYPKN